MHNKEIKSKISYIVNGLSKKNNFDKSIFLEQMEFDSSLAFFYPTYFIRLFKENRNKLFLSDLVEFLTENHIFDLKLVKFLFRLFLMNNSVILRLVILDYYNICPVRLLPKHYDKKLLLIYKKTNSTNLKCQIAFNLVSYEESNFEYFEILLYNLKKTKDVRAMLRTLGCLQLLNDEGLKIAIIKTCKSSQLYKDSDTKTKRIIMKLIESRQ